MSKPVPTHQHVYHADPEILGGVPVFRGTRVPVQSLFDHLKAGDSIAVFLDGFPSVRREQVVAVLEEKEKQIAGEPKTTQESR
jgi:uncharacterized protein (DUF433 family)